MKQSIKDSLQIVVALLITGSTAYAMQPTQLQQPLKSTSKVVHISSTDVKRLVKTPVVTPKAVQSAIITPTPATAPPVAPQPVITWQSNPNNCTADQWISSDAPFSCIDKPVPAPVAAAVQAAPTAISSGCGDNSYANYIYMHESSCSLTVTNAEGCVGIGQACPASKLYAACPNLSYACENAWFSNYAVARYGGWAGAYTWWVANHYW